MLCDLSPGGAERLVLELCRRHAPDITPSVATVQGFGALEAAFREAGVPLLRGGRPRRHPGLRALARLIPAVASADVVHTHLYAGDTWGRIAGLITRHPAVLTTEHNIDRDEAWRSAVRRALTPLSHVVVGVSAPVVRGVRGARDLRLIENGIAIDRFRPHPGGPGTRVLAIGRRVRQKGFDVLVRALPDDMTLDIAGEGPERTEHPRVRWLGRREDIPALLAAADILAVPSRWEGFGLAAAEGLAAGIAVVASAVDGLAEVVGDAGLLVPPDDPVALRAALERLRDDAALRGALGAAGRSRAEARFDVRAMVARYEEIYRELAGKRDK